MEKVIGIDTSLFIYLLEENQYFLPKVKKILTAVEEGKWKGILSVIGMIEVLTGPKQKNRHDIAFEYRELLTHFPNLEIAGITEYVIDCSSDLRARYRISTPDAIHIATALDQSASVFYTNDKRLKNIQEIKIQTL